MFQIDKKKLFELETELEKLDPFIEYLRKKLEKDTPLHWAINKVYHYVYLLRRHMSDYLEKLEQLETEVRKDYDV